MAADGTSFTNNGIAAPALTEAEIRTLAAQAVEIAIQGEKRLRRLCRSQRLDAAVDAAEIVRDFLHLTARGKRRINRQRQHKIDPAIVLTPRGLAATLRNSLRDKRRMRKRHREADQKNVAAGIDAGEIVRESRGEDAPPALVAVELHPDADPVLWTIAQQQARDDDDYERANWTPAKPIVRKPKPILHLRRGAQGGAP